MLKMIHKIFSRISTVLLVLLVAATAGLVLCRILGMPLLTVLSGSMEPTYPTGSVICVKPVDTDTLEKGDIITYLISDNTFVTHRIMGVVPDEKDPDILRFRTKGDANNTEDMTLVHENNIIGTPIFCIPMVGYAVNYVQHPPGTYIAIMAASGFMMIMILVDLFTRKNDDEQDEE